MSGVSPEQLKVAGTEGSNAPYRFELQTRVSEIDRQSWERVCRGAGDPFMELRYLLANENAFRGEAQFWYATLLDEQGRAIGCTCFTRYHVDVAMLGPAFTKWSTALIRRVWKSFLKVPVLLGGSPVSTCRGQLILSDEADSNRVVATLDAIVAEIVKQAPVEYIGFKEFKTPLCDRVSGLQKFGFLRLHSQITYDLFGEYDSFQSYLATRGKLSRARIRKRFQKLEAEGLTCVQCRGGEGAVERFTDEVHRLYLNVLGKAKKKLERLPAEFFRELARQYPEESRFTFVYKAGRPVAFVCGLDSPGSHVLLFCGLDYKLNTDGDLYFYGIYRSLGFALRPGVKTVLFGSTADKFKTMVGCKPSSVWIYLKGVGILRSALVNSMAWILFPKPHTLPEQTELETETAAAITTRRAA